ncbi:hypothetical protein PYH68_05465 [Staphylococcus xylosus]|uniref:hypothetical protein n=1 Tax=Staphylococcus xylosus TaxID=1288 RepID=UPI003364DDB6
MRVISCRIKRSNIIYEVESDSGNVFYKSLPKKVTANEASKRLRKVSDKVDKK